MIRDTKGYEQYMVDQHGKKYMTVAGRLKMFWDYVESLEKPPEASITSEITFEGERVICRTHVSIAGLVRATGWGMEVIGDGLVNKDAAVENCETSAIGRALGNLGIGLIEAGGVATADEIEIKKVSSQSWSNDAPTEKQLEAIKKLKAKLGEDPNDLPKTKKQASAEMGRLIEKSKDIIDYGDTRRGEE